jgi:hypothetical protein
MYRAIECQCGWPSCKSWQVRGLAPEAKFTKERAEAVADLLNQMDTAQTSFTVHIKQREENQ